MLETFSPADWRTTTLCSNWSVAHVTAHLSAGANTGTAAWLRSIIGARFNTDRHNERRLAKYLGASPDETLAHFADAVSLTIAPTKDHAAWLGEVVVHGQDIARPLGIILTPDPAAVLAVAQFYARKDFAVNSASLVKGLSLAADDSPFAVGEGPEVRGRLLDLVMVMAGRPEYLSNLSGAGVNELRRRIGSAENS